MRRRLRTSVASLVLLSILLVNLPLAALAAARELLERQHAEAVRLLSHYVVGSDHLVDERLNRLGFQPPVEPSVWRGYPVIRKLETACLMAEAAEPGRGCDKLLALISQYLAQIYGPVRGEAVLARFLSEKVGSSRLAFAAAKIPRRPGLPADVTAAIGTIAAYCYQGPLGSPQRVMVVYFGLTYDEAYKLLYESDSHADAFVEAYARAPERERTPMLGRLARALAPHYGTLRSAPALVALGIFPGYGPSRREAVAGANGGGGTLVNTKTPEFTVNVKPSEPTVNAEPAFRGDFRVAEPDPPGRRPAADPAPSYPPYTDFTRPPIMISPRPDPKPAAPNPPRRGTLGGALSVPRPEANRPAPKPGANLPRTRATPAAPPVIIPNVRRPAPVQREPAPRSLPAPRPSPLPAPPPARNTPVPRPAPKPAECDTDPAFSRPAPRPLPQPRPLPAPRPQPMPGRRPLFGRG